ncbi:hypothetical protein F52700_4925 [Fusarium sp. NRRL 52700]|nr:hypothetical protein F52700_4925 [Fusarium sp. NRRL 52700]
MKLTVIALALMSGIGLVMAGDGCGGGKECQCLFADGSHCCVYGDNHNPLDSELTKFHTQNGESGDTGDCVEVCKGAQRVLQSGESEPASCNAGGKFSCVSVWNAQWRTPCYNENNGK